jgi:hypothetical protein
MANDAIKGYLNTLIFVIVAKACIVALLVTLIFDWGWSLSFLILTIVLGLSVIILYAILNIYKIEKAIKKAKEAQAKVVPQLDICPDYFVRSLNADQESPSYGNVLCEGKYTGESGRFTYDFTPSQPSTINLTAMTHPYKTMNDMCSGEQSNFNGISWTDFKAKCGILDTYAGNV